MKINKFVLFTALAFTVTSGPVLADGNAFTPLNFDDTAYSSTPASDTKSSGKVINVKSSTPSATVTTNATVDTSYTGNDNIQNAILQLDNAQIEIRNDLLNYKSKFQNIDEQYKLVRNERNMLQKQIKSVEKRIKNIDRAKDKIRKNMI